MKKIFIALLSVFMLSAVFSNVALAQTAQTTSTNTPTAGVIVATVNVNNAKIVSQNDRNFVISFDISNRIGAQPQIKYSIRLVKILSKSQTTVDQKVYDDVFSLGENQTINKQINYTVPNSLPAGEYQLWLSSENMSGLPLVNIPISMVNIKESTSNSIEIVNNSCVVSISNSSTTTNDKQKIIAKCDVKSTYHNDIVLTPNIITKVNTMFGNIVPTSSGILQDLTIKNGTSSISFELSNPVKPQRYYVNFSLTSKDNLIKSNEVNFVYDIPGDIGVIENVVLDKTSYKAGDIANVQLMLYGNVASGTISILMLDGNGKPCSDTVIKLAESYYSIKVPITSDCTNPKANIILSTKNIDGKEIILDQRNFEVLTPKENSTGSISLNTVIIYSILVLLSIIILFIIRRKTSVIKSIIIVLAIFSTMFGFSKLALADTFGDGAWNMDYTYKITNFLFCSVDEWPSYKDKFTVTTNKTGTAYNVGDAIGVTMSYSWLPTNDKSKGCTDGSTNIKCVSDACGNTKTQVPHGQMGATIDDSNYSMSDFPNQVNWGDYNAYNKYITLTLPTSIGSHNINLKMGESGAGMPAYLGDTNIYTSIPFTVVIHNPVGVFTYADCNTIQGWVCDGDNYSAPIDVVLVPAERGQPQISTTANLSYGYTPIASCGGNTAHDFRIATPDTLKDGLLHTLTAYGMNIGSGDTNTVLGRQTISGCYPPANVTAHIDVSSLTVQVGRSVNISWSSTLADTCALIKDGVSWGPNPNATSGSNFGSGNLNTIKTVNITVTCQNTTQGGSNSDTAFVTVTPIPIHLDADENNINWSAEAGSTCTLSEGTPLVVLSTATQGSTSTAALPANTLVNLSCKTADNISYSTTTRTVAPAVQSTCYISNTGSTDNNTYVNRKITWGVNLPTGLTNISRTWSGDNITTGITGLLLDKVYTTVGAKTIHATTTGTRVADGSPFTSTCYSSTVIRLDKGTNGEI